MADRVLPGPVESTERTDCNVNIHSSKIYDCCRDKDCVEDLRVYPTAASQALINTAFSVRPSTAVLLTANVNVDAISFNRGHYTVDVTYFYKVSGTTFPGGSTVTGLAVFNKRVILFGSEGTAKVFSSAAKSEGLLPSDDRPIAYVEAVDPIVLNMRVVDGDNGGNAEPELPAIPARILGTFGEELKLSGAGRRLYVTLGQFSVIRLERDTQLTLNGAEYFFPSKECIGSSEDDPCTLFGRVRFPVEEFIPPDDLAPADDYKNLG